MWLVFSGVRYPAVFYCFRYVDGKPEDLKQGTFRLLCTTRKTSRGGSLGGPLGDDREPSPGTRCNGRPPTNDPRAETDDPCRTHDPSVPSRTPDVLRPEAEGKTTRRRKANKRRRAKDLRFGFFFYFFKFLIVEEFRDTLKFKILLDDVVSSINL